MGNTITENISINEMLKKHIEGLKNRAKSIEMQLEKFKEVGYLMQAAGDKIKSDELKKEIKLLEEIIREDV